MKARSVLLAVVGLLSFTSVLNYQGVCLSNMRSLPEDEVFRLAIQRAINFDSAKRVGSDEFVNTTILPYENVDDFRAANPDCCQFAANAHNPDDPPVYFLDRILGFGANTVILSYQLNYIDPSGHRKTEKKSRRFTVGNCGGTIS